MTVDVMDVMRVADRQIIEHWNVVDWLGLVQQLGVMSWSGATSR